MKEMDEFDLIEGSLVLANTEEGWVKAKISLIEHVNKIRVVHMQHCATVAFDHQIYACTEERINMLKSQQCVYRDLTGDSECQNQYH